MGLRPHQSGSIAMTDRANAPSATNYAPSRYRCPKCSEDLIRTARRPTDRLLSLFSPVYRYRCRNHACQWEGNIKVDRSQRAPPPDPKP